MTAEHYRIDERIVRLETQYEHIDGDIKELKQSLLTVERQGTRILYAVLACSLSLLAGMATLIFQTTLAR